ncbi:MAG TPA: hypothetical protein VN132_08380 [Bdellovibrio sp.]|nr:hypothetical protein [Bdellovibrio sp.]
MRKFLAIALICFSGLSTFAASSTVYVDGDGTSSSFCTANDYFCPRTTEQTAEANATSDAQYRCEQRHGHPLNYTLRCNTICNPSYIPPNTSTWVNCRSTCSLQCDI